MIIYMQDKTGFIVLGTLGEIYADNSGLKVVFGSNGDFELEIGTYKSKKRTIHVIEYICQKYLEGEKIFYMPEA